MKAFWNVNVSFKYIILSTFCTAASWFESIYKTPIYHNSMDMSGSAERRWCMEKNYSELKGLVLFITKSCISQTFLFLPQCPPQWNNLTVTMSPCYGYGQSNISPKGSHHNHRCTIRARIVLCLYKRFLSVPPRHNGLVNESNRDWVIGPLQHLNG